MTETGGAVRRTARQAFSVQILGVFALAASVLAACGSSSGTPTLNWYINPDNGGQAKLAEKCGDASGGRYQIETSVLPNDATQQREQLCAGSRPKTPRSI